MRHSLARLYIFSLGHSTKYRSQRRYGSGKCQKVICLGRIAKRSWTSFDVSLFSRCRFLPYSHRLILTRFWRLCVDFECDFCLPFRVLFISAHIETKIYSSSFFSLTPISSSSFGFVVRFCLLSC